MINPVNPANPFNPVNPFDPPVEPAYYYYSCRRPAANFSARLRAMESLPMDILVLFMSLIDDRCRPRCANRRLLRAVWYARRRLALTLLQSLRYGGVIPPTNMSYLQALSRLT
jgi:hypothetical protein